MMLRTQLVAAFLGVALLVGGFSIVSITSIEFTQHTFNEDASSIADKRNAFHTMAHAVHLALLNAFIYHHTGEASAKQMAETHLDTITRQEAVFSEHATDEQIAAVTAANQEVTTVVQDALQAELGDTDALSSLSRASADDGKVMQTYHTRIDAGIRDELQTVLSDIDSSFNRSEYLVLITSFLTMFIASILGLLLSNHISRPLHELQSTIERISKGDMTVTLSEKLKTRNDEIGVLSQSFDRTLTSLKLAMHRTAPHLEEEVVEKEQDLQKTAALLKATIETAQEGLIVVDHDGNVLEYNTKFLEMWDLTASFVETAKDMELRDKVLDKLKDPETFSEKVDYLINHPEEESRDILEFKDGRVYARYSRPAHVNGETIGRIWDFQDVTDE